MSRSLTLDALFGFALKLSGSVILFALSVYLSRRMGAEFLGAFSLFMSVLLPMSVLGRLGFDVDLLRLLSRARAEADENGLRGLYKQSFYVVLLASTIWSILMILVKESAEWLGLSFEVLDIFAWLALALPFHALLMLNAGFIRGNHYLIWAAVHENVSVHLLIFGILLTAFELFSIHFSVFEVVGGIVLASLLSCIHIGLLLRRFRADQSSGAIPSVRERCKHAIPMCATSLATIGFATLDVLLLSFFVDYKELGYYAAAAKLVAFVSFPIMAVIGMVGPRFSDADARKDNAELRKIYRHATRLAGLAGLPLVLAIALIPETLLAIFGDGFEMAVASVQVLLVGQLATLLLGPVGYLLWMTGHAPVLQKVTLSSLSVFVLSSLILMPTFGMEGAAFSLSFALLLKSLGCAWLVKSRLGFNAFFCSWLPYTHASN